MAEPVQRPDPDALLAQLSGSGTAVAPAEAPPPALAKEAAAHESSLLRLRAARASAVTNQRVVEPQDRGM